MQIFCELGENDLICTNGGGFLGFIFVGAAGTLVGMGAALGLHITASVIGYDNIDEVNKTADDCIKAFGGAGMALGILLPF